MNNLTDQQKFRLKIGVALLGGFAGWLAATFGTSWDLSKLTPIALAGLFTIVASVVGGIYGITTPNAARAVDIALLSGVRTKAEVQAVSKATDPGYVPSPEVAAAILGKPAPPTAPQTPPAANP